MGAKKAPAAKKAAAKPKAAAQGGSRDARWVVAQITALQEQRATATSNGESWLEEAHSWHISQLEQVLEKLEAGEIQGLSDDLREGVEVHPGRRPGMRQVYVAQVADGVDESSFYNDEELYAAILAGPDAAAAEAPYTRAEETEESCAAIEEVRAWSETSQYSIAKFAALLKRNASSAGVQEAGLTKVSQMIMAAKDAPSSSATLGLQFRTIFPIVSDAMKRFPQDTELQGKGIVAMRSFIASGGAIFEILELGVGKLVIETMRTHMRHSGVVLQGARTLALMANKSPKNSPEWASLCSIGTEDILTEAIPMHPNDPNIEKTCRQTIPFLRG